RDASWMGQIYNFLGLSVSCIQNQRVTYVYDKDAKADAVEADVNADHTLNEEEKAKLAVTEDVHTFKVDMDRLRLVQDRKEAYTCDITYGTNNEFGFDYLRDNMATTLEQKSQRGLSYAIIDEVDSILIDEARTPLIISAPDSESTSDYITYKNIVASLVPHADYSIDEKMRTVAFTEVGQDSIAKLLGRDPWKEMDYGTTFHIEAALKARALFTREKDYVVQGNEVVIVDEFTGRMMHGRRYSEGLHQALEAKEGVPIQKESKTMATITFQNYFRMYDKLSGMTGTAVTEKEEFFKIYGIDVIVVPTHRTIQRFDYNDLIYKNEKAKFAAVVKEVATRNAKGQPVLIGTISIEKNETLAKELDRAGIAYEMLNAKNHEKEAEVISRAGMRGAVTLATNMAGRGVDIILGGVNKEGADEIRALGGLHVIGTERHESRRIDNQLRGRTGRQGDVGSSQFFVSLDDDLMRIFGSDRIRSVMERLKVPDDMPIENSIISKSLEAAQKKVEGHNFDIRKRVVEYDTVINKQRHAMYEYRDAVLETQGRDEEHEVLKNMVLEMLEKEIESIVLFHTASEDEYAWELTTIYEAVGAIFAIDEAQKKALNDIRAEAGDMAQDHESRQHIISYLMALANAKYEAFEKAVNDTKRLAQIERSILLQSIDQHWVAHLDNMQHLRSGIGLRGYAQKDPLIEYKKEAFGLYNSMRAAIGRQVVFSFFKIGSAVSIVAPRKQEVIEVGAQKEMTKGATMSDTMNTAVTSLAPQTTNTYNGQKVGRNDECPCGSGKKYKKCHGA
ncbi:preprotein translocase subunit SecA, partial [Candidatus Falkowbacteria bacterium]|nr:preprotein translocase subunit SecA [Candidatus Falkowbacteria bacterium]